VVIAREIASISFGRSRKGVLVCQRIYFDGSGKENDHKVITVGGFLAESSVCEAIEADWQKATDGHVFHLKDYGTNKCKLGSLGWTKTEREDFLKKLAAIVNRAGCYIMSATIEVAVFNETLRKAEYPQEIGPAFSGCAGAAIYNAESYLLNENRQRQKVQYVFEKGDREHEISITFAEWDKQNSQLCGMRGHSFEPKSVTLLQPADLIAGIVQRCAVRAYAAFPCLENGLARTRLNNFERYYDGVTAAVVAGHDSTHCWIVNPKSFAFLDSITKRFFANRPVELNKRRKRATFQPKGTA
jgi:hypothetical protein